MKHIKKIKIINVVGARPNFMKIAPIITAMRKEKKYINYLTVHTGQHYDREMSQLFFKQLEIPKPDINLGVGSGSHAWQTAKIMRLFESIVVKYKPHYVLVVGDVNSTAACSLVAKKLGVKVIHVEAGLRSFDNSMPEEINRILTDRISDMLFTHSYDANLNLKKEGIPNKNIFMVGNVMIDTLLRHRSKAKHGKILSQLGLNKKDYFVITLHRPSNVDVRKNLKNIINTLIKISKFKKIIFPINPRTKKNLSKWRLLTITQKYTTLTPPLGYLDFLNLMANAQGVLTDSGGIQEETTILNVPCLTLRDNTERPITVEKGTNTITNLNEVKILREIKKIISGRRKRTSAPPLWDGRSAERIIKIIKKYV